LCATTVIDARAEASEMPLTLEQWEARIEAEPNDPMSYYRKCQVLFAAGRQQDAVDFAEKALAAFIRAENNLAWMLLGSIHTDKYRIDVHFNMGPRERAEKKDGIVRPYSFRVWSNDTDSPGLVRILDFELAYIGGTILTGAIGQMNGHVHANYGMVGVDADFAAVKAKVLSVLGVEERTAATPEE